MNVFNFIFGKSIFQAIEEGDLETTKAILDKSPNKIHTIDGNGLTPLHCAVDSHVDIAVELIRRGARIPVQNPGGPLHWAIETKRLEIALCLVDTESDINITDADQCSPVAKAAATGMTPVVRKLIEKNVNLDTQTKKGYTALHLALKNANIEAAIYLIETRKALNIRDSRGRTALCLAIKEKHFPIVTKLLDNGADVELEDENGWRAIHRACSDENEEVLAELLCRGANPNAQDENGWTPLHLASWKGYSEMIGMLLKHRSDVNLTTVDGNTALMWCLRGTSSRHKAVADRLLDAGADVTIANKEGQTPLHKAAQLGYGKMAMRLLDLGADIEAKNNEGETPLDVAKDENVKNLLKMSLAKKKIVDTD